MSNSPIDVADYYNKGLSWEDYLAVPTSDAHRLQEFYDEFEFDEEVLADFGNRTPLQVIAVVDDTTPDVPRSLAVLARISEEVPGMELAIVRTEDSPELMEVFLTEGERRVPAIAFFDMTFVEVARWSGRCKSANDWITTDVLKGRSSGDLSDTELATFNSEYDERYKATFFWDTVEEWRRLFEDEDY
jgi:hypothetical protein